LLYEVGLAGWSWFNLVFEKSVLTRPDVYEKLENEVKKKFGEKKLRVWSNAFVKISSPEPRYVNARLTSEEKKLFYEVTRFLLERKNLDESVVEVVRAIQNHPEMVEYVKKREESVFNRAGRLLKKFKQKVSR